MYGYNNLPYDDFKETFSLNLLQQMAAKGYTVYNLSKMCDIPRNSLTKYLNGSILPSLPNLINLTYVLKCDITDLIPTKYYIEK